MSEILPPEKRLQFFVFIIESPSPVDLYHRRGEGEVIRNAVGLNLIPSELRLAVNREAFEAAIRIGLSDAMREHPNRLPILHISAHGFDEGIQLSSGEVLDWSELRDLLLPVNRALGGSLILCMSTCEGYSGSRMAMRREECEHPFYAIVGNGRKPSWPETAVAFATFYHLVACGRYIVDAVEAMRIASGNDAFFVTTAEESRRGFLEYIQSIDAQDAQEVLEVQADEQQPNPLGKLLIERRG
ncbi:conserved hypothetical protein [uncultured Defluviicoccus sp.]|uniref:CHAT domain-containing protein n=1 Tax=metagenome TaxID=256318 RepID=A0A380TBS0_9ZZZZ|nr:conserved hypothetical protein [uncultured Defluviicoccus sp.]